MLTTELSNFYTAGHTRAYSAQKMVKLKHQKTIYHTIIGSAEKRRSNVRGGATAMRSGVTTVVTTDKTSLMS